MHVSLLRANKKFVIMSLRLFVSSNDTLLKANKKFVIMSCSFSNANGLLVGFYLALALLFYEVGGSPLLKLQRFRVHKTNGAGVLTISSVIARVQILGWNL